MAGRKLLYITPLWSGIVSFFFEGKKEFKGMPAFNKVFSKIIDSADFDPIEIVLYVRIKKGEQKSLNLPEQYSFLNVKAYYYSSGIGMVWNLIKSFFYILRLVKQKQIDVLYAHGGIGAIAGICNLFLKRRLVQRIYGSFMINEIDKSKLQLFLAHPLEYLAFRMKADHVVITNDGTHGDKVYQKIGNPSKLHFLLNGINRSQAVSEPNLKVPSEPFITYIARVDRWKQQDVLIKAVKQLKEVYGKEIPTLIIGQFANDDFKRELEFLIETSQLEKVELIGPLPNPEASWLMKHSLLTMSLYNTSNLGNVFLEAISMGIPMVAVNCNHSLDVFPEQIYYKLDDYNVSDIAKAIHEVSESKELRDVLSLSSKNYADCNIKSWNERVEREIQLLK